MTYVLFIALLVVLILVHEFGHFSVAKLFGIRVDEFGIFFPPRIFAWKFGETEYSLNWLPLGGFVRIFGENYDEGQSDPRSFTRKPRYVQALVLVAGVAFNLIFAWLILSVGYMAGLPTAADHVGFGTVQDARATIIDVLPGSPAEKAGLIAGDSIVDVQTGTATLPQDSNSDQVTQFIAAHQNESIGFTVDRDGVQKEFLAVPANGLVAGKKAVGVELDDVGVLKLNPVEALGEGAVLGWNITETTAQGLSTFGKELFTGSANFNDVSGPIGITAFGAATLKQGFAAGVVLMALISINLAIINLIPIPGLDGGRLLIVVIEAVIRRPVSSKVVANLTMVGFALLLLLIAVVSYHDVLKLVHPAA